MEVIFIDEFSEHVMTTDKLRFLPPKGSIIVNESGHKFIVDKETPFTFTELDTGKTEVWVPVLSQEYARMTKFEEINGDES